MTNQLHSSQPGEEAILLDYARETIRVEIVSNLGKLAAGYFTPEELSEAEVRDTLSDPDAPSFPNDRLTTEDILNILANMVNRTPEEDFADQIDELEYIGGNEDHAHYESERLQAAEQALVDYKDIKLFIDMGMSQDQAIVEVLKLRQSDIEFQVSYWRAGYAAAKEHGFAVPATLEEWARLKPSNP